MRGLSGIFGSQIMTALGTLFNALALNLVLVVVSLPVVTLPAAVSAATTALERWRGEGEDRVVREFVIALRTQPWRRTTLLTGVPLAAVAVGVAEVLYFSHYPYSVALAGWVAMGLGAGALLLTLMSLGYVFLLSARGCDLAAAEFWSLCVRLGVRNLFRTGPLFLAEIAAATALIVIDPALVLLGVPLALLQLMRLTARSGLRGRCPRRDCRARVRFLAVPAGQLAVAAGQIASQPDIEMELRSMTSLTCIEPSLIAAFIALTTLAGSSFSS
ncbi:MAG: hypothetical protein ACRDN0_17530 [Trebonia sp.]